MNVAAPPGRPIPKADENVVAPPTGIVASYTASSGPKFPYTLQDDHAVTLND